MCVYLDAYIQNNYTQCTQYIYIYTHIIGLYWIFLAVEACLFVNIFIFVFMYMHKYMNTSSFR